MRNFDLTTREMIVLLAGLLGLLEQEIVRVVSHLLGTPIDPSTILSGVFGSMVLGSIGVGVVRNVTRGNGNGGKS